MKKMMNYTLIAMIAAVVSGCGPKAFVKGDYDDNVQDANLLNDKWSESDMQKAVRDLVSSATSHYAISSSKRPPVVMVSRLQNKTSEHIDTQSVTDMMRVELMRGGKVQFVDKAAREDMAEEVEYQKDNASRTTRKEGGQQIGADFILNGRIDSIVQQAGRDKSVYYKMTMNMTNLKTGIIVWSDYKQIRKRFKKQRVGL